MMSSGTINGREAQDDAAYQKEVQKYALDRERREFRNREKIQKKGLRQYHIDLYANNEQRNADTEAFLRRTAIKDAIEGKTFQIVVFDASTGEESRSVLNGAPGLPEPGEKVHFKGREVPVIAARLMLQKNAGYSDVFVDVLVDAHEH